MKYLIVSLIIFAGLAFSSYYLYMYDKKNHRELSDSVPIAEQSERAELDKVKTKESLPVYLTNDFWKRVTPEELDVQLKNIANVNEVRPDNKRSMLHLLVLKGTYPEMVKMLIGAGVDYKLRDEVNSKVTGGIDNRKALFYAILREEKSNEFVETLLEYDDVNSYIGSMSTALIIATFMRKPLSLIQLLLKKGADPNLKSRNTQSNSILTASKPNNFLKIFTIDPKVILLLLDHKADITAKNKSGKSAFDYMKENEEFKKTDLFKKMSSQFSQ